MTSRGRTLNFADLRLIGDYLRAVRNEIAVDVHGVKMAGLDPAHFGKIPRPPRWIGKAKRFALVSRLVQHVSLPVWRLLAPRLFKRQYRAVQAGRRPAGSVTFDPSGQVLPFSVRALDIVHPVHIDFAPRQWLELPWLQLDKLPAGAHRLAALDLLDDADMARSLQLATLAHHVLQRQRGMEGWGLQSYTAWRWFLARLAVDKLPGPLLTVDHFDRWAVLVDTSMRGSKHQRPRRLTLMQHGSVNADITPRGLGIRLPSRLRAVSHLHAYSEADVEIFKAEILAPQVVQRGLDVSFYRPSITLSDMADAGIPAILFVGYPLCEAAHCALLKALRAAGSFQLFYKPHPASRKSASIGQHPWTLVEGRTVFPRVDLLISYPSTLVSEYAAHGIPAVVHRMDVPADQLVDRMSEILHAVQSSRSAAAKAAARQATDNPIRQTQ